MPTYFLILRYVSWFGYASENLLINQFSGITSIECDDEEDLNSTNSTSGIPKCLKKFNNGEEVLDYFTVDPDKFYFNLACMFILIIGWRIMTYLVLLIKSRHR